MSDTVLRVDLHKETTPAGVTVIIPQLVKAAHVDSHGRDVTPTAYL